MTNNIKNPSAFPTDSYPNGSATQGMSLRDYFAAAAMQGLVSKFGLALIPVGDKDFGLERTAYHIADSMLKARVDE